jgi:hypothetical protein
MFFFEKKNQKTFASKPWPPTIRAMVEAVIAELYV